MIFLLATIILTSWLTLSFKLVERFRISNIQAIVFNYVACVLTGSVVNGSFPVNTSTFKESWFIWAVVMGTVFIFLFNVIGITAQQLGVAVASVANKLSLVIPFLFSVYLYNEKATVLKIGGIVIALAAVILSCWPTRHKEPSGKEFKPSLLIFPIILFIVSGLLDTMIKYVEQAYLNDTNKNDYLITAFAVAASIGLIILLLLFASGKEKFDYRAVIAGLGIGIPNYFSIWCLVRVLKDFSGNSSAIIPINNMGIVLFSTLAAWLFFKEHLSKTNWLGIALSLIAIALIAYG